MIEKYLKNKMVISIASIIIGLILMIWRGVFVEQMIHVIGYVLLAAAVVYLVMYFKNGKEDETQLGYGVVAAGAGLLLILLSHLLLRAFPVIVGVLMILIALTTLMKVYNDKNTPLYIKLLYVLVAVMGILVLLHPGRIAGALVFCVGLALVVNGVSGLLMSRNI